MSTLSLQSRIDQLDPQCPVVMSIPNIVRGQASRDIKFMLKSDFALTITG